MRRGINLTNAGGLTFVVTTMGLPSGNWKSSYSRAIIYQGNVESHTRRDEWHRCRFHGNGRP